MTRSNFYPMRMQYLFSIDMALVSSKNKTTVGQDAFSTRCAMPADGARWPVYHALNEAQVGGRDAVAGRVILVRERTRFDIANKMGELEAELVLETEDENTIQAHCSGVFSTPAGRFPLVLQELGDGDKQDALNVHEVGARSVEMKAFVSARFDTGATKYRWLASTQCVGYGRLKFANGEPTEARFDIYAMQSV